MEVKSTPQFSRTRILTEFQILVSPEEINRIPDFLFREMFTDASFYKRKKTEVCGNLNHPKAFCHLADNAGRLPLLLPTYEGGDKTITSRLPHSSDSSLAKAEFSLRSHQKASIGDKRKSENETDPHWPRLKGIRHDGKEQNLSQHQFKSKSTVSGSVL